MRISDWSSDVCSSDLLGSSGQVVGRLHLGSGKRSAFSYDERWLQDSRFFTLSPDLQPVLSVQHPQQVFFRALEDTAPDSWGERVIRRAHAKSRQKDRETPALEPIDFIRSEERRVGKECGSTGRSRRS